MNFADIVGTKLSAQVICREALVALNSARFGSPFGNGVTPPPCIGIGAPNGQLACGIAVSPYDLYMSASDFCYYYVNPLMNRFALRIPYDLQCKELGMPVGVDAAKEQYRGVNMRCIISEVGIPKEANPRIWRTFGKYYSMDTDEFVWGDMAIVVRFDVLPDKSPIVDGNQ